MRLAVTGLLFLCWSLIYPMIVSHRSQDLDDKAAKTELQLGNFSISLVVKDILVSRDFYEKLGFKVIAGDVKQKYLILQNDTSTIGLFQGMFEKNSLTYNPGWDREGKTLASFLDVRDLQQELKRRGLKPDVAADESSTGPAFFMITDPDGNPILFDQHVPKPNKP